MDANDVINLDSRPQALELLEQSRFNIWRSVKELEECYAQLYDTYTVLAQR